MSVRKLTEEELERASGAAKLALSVEQAANRAPMGAKARGVIEDPWSPIDPVYGELSSDPSPQIGP